MTDNLIMKRLAVTITLVFFSLQQIVFASADFPRESNSQKALKPCLNSVELECIESIKALYPNGKRSELKLIEGAKGSFLDEFGQIIENNASRWSYTNVQGVEKRFLLTATLNGENYKSPLYKRLYPAMWISFWEISKDEINSGIKFEIYIKSSWLSPQGITLAAKDATFRAEKGNGWFRYVFTGSPFLQTSFNSPEKFQLLNTSEQDLTKSDGEVISLNFVIDHLSSIPGGTFWTDECSPLGYIVSSSNSIGAGPPYMSDSETLRFNIGAPHRLSTGEVNQGFFTTYIPISYIDCRWPQNTLTKSPKIEVMVTNSDGTNQVATTSITLEKGILHVRAFGFHYSKPTIVVRATNKKEIPALSDVSKIDPKSPPIVAKSKKLTITCAKGKIIKKITAAKPVCPAGYKKK